jgi:hypothetical protein
MTHGSISRRSWQGRGHGDHRAPLSLLSPTPAPSLDCHLNSCVELCHFETCSQVRRPCPGTGAQGSSVRGVCRWRDGYFAPEGLMWPPKLCPGRPGGQAGASGQPHALHFLLGCFYPAAPSRKRTVPTPPTPADLGIGAGPS